MTTDDQGGSQNQDTAAAEQLRDADFSVLDGGAKQQESAAPPDKAVDPTEMQTLRAAVDENRDRYLRALADLENFKKRALKERSELLKYQGERIIADLLEVLDSLELALGHADQQNGTLRSGLELIHKLFVDTLARWEIRAVSGLGKEFDPVQQQAINRVVAPDAKPGTVMNEFKKAYFYKDKLIRVGTVVVAAEGSGAGSTDSSAGAETSEPNK